MKQSVPDIKEQSFIGFLIHVQFCSLCYKMFNSVLILYCDHFGFSLSDIVSQVTVSWQKHFFSQKSSGKGCCDTITTLECDTQWWGGRLDGLLWTKDDLDPAPSVKAEIRFTGGSLSPLSDRISHPYLIFHGLSRGLLEAVFSMPHSLHYMDIRSAQMDSKYCPTDSKWHKRYLGLRILLVIIISKIKSS